MKSRYSEKTTTERIRKSSQIALCAAFLLFGKVGIATAQPVLFDFDNSPVYTSLPITVSNGGITAYLSATGSGFSIQDANVLGFTPQGFSGHIIYPNSVFLADLLIRFDQPLTDFSIMYACQELGCDDAATMRVTAYLNGNYVGTNTRTATFPGTYPTDTLSCSFAQGFDSVVVHYDSPPPTCQDYGVIFLADNMVVTALNTGILAPEVVKNVVIFPNPLTKTANISFNLAQSSNIRLAIYDVNNRLVKVIFDGNLNTGQHQFTIDAVQDKIDQGIYFLNISGNTSTGIYKFIVVR